MKWTAGTWLGAAALGLSLCGAARAAVMTAEIKVVGAGPYTFTYYLAQQVTTMQVKIVSQSGTVVRTIDVSDPNATTPGKHDQTNGVVWDGLTDGGAAAPPGTYYAQIDTTGDAVTVATLLSPRKTFPAAPGKGQARTVYGGAANRDVTSPYHNLAYFGIADTGGTNSSSGVAYARPDSSSSTFPIVAGSAAVSGSYDYASASLLTNGTILLAGQTLKQFVTVSPLDFSIQNIYGKGKFDVRGIQAFGNEPNATVYYVDDVAPYDIKMLSSLTSTTPTSIIPGATFTIQPRVLVVNRAQTALWVCGGANGAAGAPGAAFVYKFVNQGGTWNMDGNFNVVNPDGGPAVGYIRGLALSPDESTLWISTNSSSNLDITSIYAVNSNTGANLGPSYYLSLQGTMTPQALLTTAGDANNNASTSYNIYVAGYDWSVPAANTTANSVAVVAPPDPDQVKGSSDSTRSQLFDVVGSATGVTVTGGPTVTNVTDTSATISWTTDFRSDSTVHLGTTAGAYTLPDTTNAASVTSHTLNVQNLAPGTTYYFQVESARSGLDSGKKTGSFTTTPNITVKSESLTTTTSSATLNLALNVPAAANITWGTAPDALTNTAISLPSAANQQATFTGLAAGTTYYYQIALTSANANPLTTGISTFATAANGGTNATQTLNNFNLDQKTGLVTNGAAVQLPVQGVPTAPLSGPPLPGPMYFGGTAAYNGYLYYVGGTDSTGTVQNTVYYAKILADGSLDYNFGGGLGWALATNSMPLSRTEVANSVFAYNGYLYVVGGSDGTAPAASVLYAPLDPTTGDVGAWKGLAEDLTTPVNPMPKTLTRGTARVVDGEVIVSGGAQAGAITTGEFTARVRPDGSLGPWQTTTPLFRSVWDQSLVGNAHTLYFIGGESGGNKLTSVDVATLQPTGDPNKALPVTNYPGHTDSVLPVVTNAAAAGLAGGKLITVGGSFTEIISGNVQGTKNVLYSKVLGDNLPGPWTNATAADAGTALLNDAANLSGAVYNNVLYTVGGRGLVSKFAGGTTFDTAVADVSIFMLYPDPDDTGYAAYGTLESKIVDLGSLTNLQHLKVTGTNVSTSTVSVRYRFANNDGAFTDWYDLGGVDNDITGGARYFQYQVVLKGSASATPSVASVVLNTGAAVTPPDKFTDVRNALRIAGGLQAATSADKTKLDVDGNGRIDILDALKMSRQINTP